MKTKNSPVLIKRVEGTFNDLFEKAKTGDKIDLGEICTLDWRPVINGIILRKDDSFEFIPFKEDEKGFTQKESKIDKWVACGSCIAYSRGKEFFLLSEDVAESLGYHEGVDDYKLTRSGLFIRQGNKISRVTPSSRDSEKVIGVTALRDWDAKDENIFFQDSVSNKITCHNTTDGKQNNYPGSPASNWQIGGKYLIRSNPPQENTLFVRELSSKERPKGFNLGCQIHSWRASERGVFFTETNTNRLCLLVIK